MRILGRFLYGALFVAVLPALLIWWAQATTRVVSLPVLPYAWAGYILAAVGLVVVISGMLALAVYGKGLPMNAYPPAIYVTRGIYRYTAHPIYVGFVLLSLGAAVALKSPSGIWLVSPAVALGAVALVLGYERHDLRRRFGEAAIHRPRVTLPPDSLSPPTGWDRASVYLLVFIPWSVAYELAYRLGVPPDAVIAHFSFETQWPVMEWTEVAYGSVYLFVLSVPFIVHTQKALRRFAMLGLIATAVVTLIYLTVPIIAPPRPFEPRTFLGRALTFERSMSHTVAAFPAFHVIWSLIAADAWASRSRFWGAAGWTWAILISISCITTGMHALADLAAAALVFVVLLQYSRIWETLRHASERIANSWREWRCHGGRLINYGLYAAMAGAVGFWISTSLGGREVYWDLVLVHVCGLVGAGLWAQQLEGSSRLSRPFGYYGSVIGILVAALLVGAVNGNTILILALFAVEAPWVQLIGRLRCLVQGCCHGFETRETIGIRYWQPRSRVCTLAELRGVPLHPTPLYSILANVVIGIILFRLWSLGAALGLIAGAYLILAGLARFVEESYRGEPQTKIIAGLRIYQWMAIVSVALGIVLTTIPGGYSPGLVLGIDARVLAGGALYGALVGFAMGVDFPGSERRFARLASP